MTTDTSESGLERLICTALTGHPCDPGAADGLRERPAAYGAGWLGGNSHDYDCEYCLDLAQLSAFLQQTQPETAGQLSLEEDSRRDASSWPGCRAKSTSAAPSTCCARASNTSRTASTSSTARRLRTT